MYLCILSFYLFGVFSFFLLTPVCFPFLYSTLHLQMGDESEPVTTRRERAEHL